MIYKRFHRNTSSVHESNTYASVLPERERERKREGGRERESEKERERVRETDRQTEKVYI